MNYFAGNPSNTSKFMQASFNPTEFANLSQGLEALQEAAALNAGLKTGTAALGGFARAQEAAAQRAAEKQIASITKSADRRANFMSGLGTAVSAGAGLYKGLQGLNKFSYGQTPIGAGGGVVDGVGTLGPNYGIPQQFGAGGGYVEGFGGTLGPNFGIQ